MPYPEELKRLIKVVESTRAERVERKKRNEEVPFLSLDERAEMLKHHPDVKEEGRRELKVGPSKGYRIAHEMADLLEAKSRVNPSAIDLSKIDYETDVLVIGGGGAGTAASILAAQQGCKVIIATKLRHGDANTMMAEGGIQAATKGHKDSPYFHYLDVMGGGHFKNTPELVETLCNKAPDAIKWLESLGCNFSKFDDGTLKTIHGGGTSRKRMHSARDYTGGELMKTLRDELLNHDIPSLEFAPAVELLTENGRCTGAVLLNLETNEYLVVRAKCTILATGGSGRLHIQDFPTTNHYGATGDGVVLAYRAGCGLKDMDTIQYHPTGAAFPEQMVGLLVTEKCRSLGGQLVNREGDRFIYELETRDAEAAAIIRECRERGGGVTTPSGLCGVWLDLPLIDIIHGEGTIQSKLPAMYRQYKRFDIDITERPILVYPTQHYQNGGVLINDHAETSVQCLYIAGESSGGVHGRNRLMGNSLLDVLVFGRRAGKFAALRSKKTAHGKLTLGHVTRYHKMLAELGVDRAKVSPLLLPDYRRKETLARAVDI